MDAGVVSEARGKLVGMLVHKFPGVRNAVLDELWVRLYGESGGEVLKSTDWTKAKKGDVERVREIMGIIFAPRRGDRWSTELNEVYPIS